MSIKLYILLVSLLLAFLIFPYIRELTTKRQKKQQKKYRSRTFWQFIDTFSEHKLIKSFLLTQENALFYKIDQYLSKNPYPTLTNIRLQAMSILSMIITLGLLFLIWANQTISVFVFRSKLEVLAREIGNPALTTISRPNVFYIMTIILAYFIPYLIFKVIYIIQGKKMENEALMLQSYTTMLLKTNTNIKYIITVLLAQATYYKEPLRECLHLYASDQTKAFTKLKEKTNDVRFISVINALEKGLFYDREMAAQYLQNAKKLQTNIKKIERQKKDKNKQLTGAILLFLPLVAFAAVAGYPWFLLVQKMLTNLTYL